MNYNWKEETCEFCMFRVGDICRESPLNKTIFRQLNSMQPFNEYDFACSKIQLESTSDEKEGNFCQCEELKNKTTIGIGSDIVGRCDYIKNHKIYHDSFVCWKCLLPRKNG